MSPEQQRIAIAEACGATWWHYVPHKCNDIRLWMPDRLIWLESDTRWEKVGNAPAKIIPCVTLERVPDYLNSLDAMHEAEKALSRDGPISQRETYESHLVLLCKGHSNSVSATATQRAEALLRTICKWQEQPTPATGEAKGES